MLVTVRQMGRKSPVLDDFRVPPPEGLGGDEDLVLRQLLEHVVRHEVQAFRDRASDRRFDRVLSSTEIDQGASVGKVTPEGRPIDAEEVDADHAVASALQAFEDGQYLVFVDEVEKRDLDETVYLRPDTQLMFVRLTFLAGA